MKSVDGSALTNGNRYACIRTGDAADAKAQYRTIAPAIEVEEVDGSPSVTSVIEFRFDQVDGFVISSPGAGIARVDMAAATQTQAGIVSTTDQRWGGYKWSDAGWHFGAALPRSASSTS